MIVLSKGRSGDTKPAPQEDTGTTNDHVVVITVERFQTSHEHAEVPLRYYP